MINLAFNYHVVHIILHNQLKKVKKNVIDKDGNLISNKNLLIL